MSKDVVFPCQFGVVLTLFSCQHHNWIMRYIGCKIRNREKSKLALSTNSASFYMKVRFLCREFLCKYNAHIAMLSNFVLLVWNLSKIFLLPKDSLGKYFLWITSGLVPAAQTCERVINSHAKYFLFGVCPISNPNLVMEIYRSEVFHMRFFSIFQLSEFLTFWKFEDVRYKICTRALWRSKRHVNQMRTAKVNFLLLDLEQILRDP